MKAEAPAASDATATPAAAGVQLDEWTRLARQWQQAAAEWATWWTRATTTASQNATAARASPTVPAVAVPFPVAWIDPGAALALQERYAGRFEALWARIASGAAAAAPSDPSAVDRRFSAKAWTEIPYFALLRDAYLLYSDYLRDLAALTQADAETRKRLSFLVEQYIDAIAPTNFLATNPEALSLAFDTAGASLAQGAANLLSDAQRGHIAMTDESAFAVGRNLAITPGDVVFRNDLVEIIQYAPTTAKVYRRPLLIVPPCINKYYILDLQPDNSFVRYAVDEGHTVFIISWRNITPELGALTWDDYLERGIMQSISVVQEISGSKTINVLGFCVGGTLLSSALAVLAARHETHVASLTLLATMLDFSDPGDICVYISRESLAAREPMLMAGGRVQGSELAGAFASLRPNELIWNYVVGNYLKGKTPPAFDLLYWNSDSANLPGPMYYYYVLNMYVENRLRVAGALTMCGQPVDLGRVAMPAYVLATREDHIVPWRSAYRSAALLGGDVEFVLGASGHIAGVINPPAKGRRNYWTNALVTDDADAWLDRAQAQPGSWWPHWAAWLASHGGTMRAAPSRAGSAHHPPLEKAPGTYVTERVS